VEKFFPTRCAQFFETHETLQKPMIENERHPSRVSFVIIFVPIFWDFSADRPPGFIVLKTPD
ncbi:MAG: hypothetical protein RR288_01695, partial [Oscillibacter sp.]